MAVCSGDNSSQEEGIYTEYRRVIRIIIVTSIDPVITTLLSPLSPSFCARKLYFTRQRPHTLCSLQFTTATAEGGGEDTGNTGERRRRRRRKKGRKEICQAVRSNEIR